MSIRPGLVSAIGPVATGEVPPWVLALVDVAFVEAEVIKQRNCVVPTLIGSIYSMNFDNMPELH